jgi:hypothetical protein
MIKTKVLDKSTKVLELKKLLTIRAEWQPKIPWAMPTDSTTTLSTRCGVSSGTRSTLTVAEGLVGWSSACLSEIYKDSQQKLDGKTSRPHQDSHQCQQQEDP